ncbi:hypothetical protein PUN28_009946 [Cardiocondyla obscurior]|uniref:Uncharacterized protein n=1 Tax=Cardiocondyla obscurior TaxID=286306 RepID=A0AAW2FN57_9HYME
MRKLLRRIQDCLALKIRLEHSSAVKIYHRNKAKVQHVVIIVTCLFNCLYILYIYDFEVYKNNNTIRKQRGILQISSLTYCLPFVLINILISTFKSKLRPHDMREKVNKIIPTIDISRSPVSGHICHIRIAVYDKLVHDRHFETVQTIQQKHHFDVPNFCNVINISYT